MPFEDTSSNPAVAAIAGRHTAGGAGVFGESTGSTPATGVQGLAASGRGVTGESVSGEGVLGTSQSAPGVLGMSTAAIGVLGTGRTGGVVGASSQQGGVGTGGVCNFGGFAIGVYGSTSDGTGVRGFSNYGSGVLGYSSFGAAVHGIIPSTNTGGMAGRFEGNVLVTGNLLKSGGGFLIDHPLDAANRYLRHSFVESPNMLNLYDGVAVLDSSGEATVELPGWFEALNEDFRYGLTPIGGPGPNVHIAKEVDGNRFMIGGGSPGMKVSWQVTGVRRDSYAVEHRIRVEEDKPDGERGKYLHPEECGQPESMGISYDPYIQRDVSAEWPLPDLEGREEDAE